MIAGVSKEGFDLTLARVQVKCAKVDGGNLEVLLEIDSLVIREWIAAIRLSGETHSLCKREKKSVSTSSLVKVARGVQFPYHLQCIPFWQAQGT